MKKLLVESDQTLLGMYHRFATEQMIFLRILRYTHERADFRTLCPMMANDIHCPFNDCLIYLAFEIVNGKVKLKIGETQATWKKRLSVYQLGGYPNIQLVTAFNSCLIVEKFLLFLCKSAKISTNQKGEW
jgi:hypothetical protein